jgi:hypothetical protein
LLIEGAATNLTKRSDNAFTNTYWNDTGNNTTAVDSAVTSPTGVALTASTLTEIAGSSLTRHIHQATGEFTPTVSTSYTMSAWVKQPASAAIRYVQFAFWTAGFGATAYMNYDIQAGTVGTGGAAITASTITAYPSGWYRITATAPATATGSSGFQLGFSTTSSAVRTESYTVSGGSEKAIYLWGAQLEVGKGASSYIPTVASQVTRAQELCTLPITPASIGLTTSPIGTCFYEATVNYLPTSGYPLIVGFADIGNNSKAWISQTSVTGSNYSSWKTSTGTVGDVTFTDVVIPKTSFKFACSISSTQSLASRNGTAGTAGAVSSAVLSVPTQLNFGGVIDSMIITKFKFFPTTKSQAELNALST